jgi:hypothetical protein
MAEFNGFTPRESPELPDDPNSGNLSIAGGGSFGSLNISGIGSFASLDISGNITIGGNELVISVAGSDLTISVVGIGSTTLALA